MRGAQSIHRPQTEKGLQLGFFFFKVSSDLLCAAHNAIPYAISPLRISHELKGEYLIY